MIIVSKQTMVWYYFVLYSAILYIHVCTKVVLIVRYNTAPVILIAEPEFVNYIRNKIAELMMYKKMSFFCFFLFFFLPGKKIPLISRINTSEPSYNSFQET